MAGIHRRRRIRTLAARRQGAVFHRPRRVLVAADIDGHGQSFDVRGTQRLFKVSVRPLTINQGFPYDVAPDGQRFVINTTIPHTSMPLILVSDWVGEVRR